MTALLLLTLWLTAVTASDGDPAETAGSAQAAPPSPPAESPAEAANGSGVYAAASEAALRLEYRGFVAGAPIGEAAVSVALRDGVYHVSGDARSNGVLAGFSRWRNRFTARGRIDGMERRVTEFSYVEEDRDKSRRVVVREGELQVTKNGRQRPKRPAPGFPDVISALFVQPHCRGDQTVHTGRHVYRLSRLGRDPGGCRYVVIDDDDDRFEIELVLVRRSGLVVPKKIVVYGWLTGWIELRDTTELAGEDI